MPEEIEFENSVVIASSTEASRTTTVEVVQSKRRMEFLTVHENELDTIASYDAHSTAFYSAGSACGSVFLTLIASGIFADKLSDVAKAISWIGIPFSFILAIFFFGMAHSSKKNKRTSIQRIKNESKGSYQEEKAG